jgi:hypothetical protein
VSFFSLLQEISGDTENSFDAAAERVCEERSGSGMNAKVVLRRQPFFRWKHFIGLYLLHRPMGFFQTCVLEASASVSHDHWSLLHSCQTIG